MNLRHTKNGAIFGPPCMLTGCFSEHLVTLDNVAHCISRPKINNRTIAKTNTCKSKWTQ